MQLQAPAANRHFPQENANFADAGRNKVKVKTP
jgi:hypothetical protein